MGEATKILRFHALLVCALVVTAASGVADSKQTDFDSNVRVFVQQNCAVCHNEKLNTAGLALTKYRDKAAMLHDRAVWEKVVARVRAGEMPPKGMPRPAPEQIAATTNWIEAQFAEFDKSTKPDPGRLTAHRLNRTEYNNTVRDLLAIKFQPAIDFPADDSGYGFDNIGDVLSVSPTLVDKYLAAATKIAVKAIPLGAIPKPTQTRYSPEFDGRQERLTLENTFTFPAEGDYDLKVNVSGKKQPMHVDMYLDGKEIESSDVIISKDKPRSYSVRLRVPFGDHQLSAVLTERMPSPEEIKAAIDIKTTEDAQFAKAIAKHPEDRAEIEKQRYYSNPPIHLDAFEVRGPFNALPPPLPESYRRVFICGHGIGQHNAQCARQDLAHLARLAYRRPVTDAEVDKLTKLVALAQSQGLSFEEAMRVGLEAILVSPNFLFRIEHDPDPNNPAAVHAIAPYELASRLSYFLWSTMPDEDLLQAAAEGGLANPEALHAQVRRMLKDPKAVALVDDFAGQWLELRNLDSIRPDPDQFPQFDKDLRKAMYTETHMFMSAVIQEDRSILDLIDGKYTFLNEKLARFYGIPGVNGNEFRRVSLDGTERSGVLTQASVLTVTSYPTRTSPVLRGKWILENVLNAPPPPPPPGVGSIDTKSGILSGTMRQIMEKHRANPSCAACHTRMDPLGFALENYNAIGQWRTQDGGQPIDSSGSLPNGANFKGSAELKQLLMSNKDAFAECLTEKLMIYALGRGLESYDRPAMKQIIAGLKSNDYKFSALINGIVDSAPFQMGRGDGGTNLSARN